MNVKNKGRQIISLGLMGLLRRKGAQMMKKEDKKQNKKQDKKQKKKTNEEKSIVNFLILHKEPITLFWGVCVSLYPIINFIGKTMYQIECEKFYGLPGRYFDLNVNNKILYCIFIIILLLISCFPAIIKSLDEKSKKPKKGYLINAGFLSIMMGMAIGLINVYNLVEIIKNTYKVNKFFRIISVWVANNIFLIYIVVIAFGVVSVLGITLMDKLRDIKCKWMDKVVTFIFLISFITSILIMLYGTIFKVCVSIEDKTKYEFVTYDVEYVVLSSDNEKNLIVPFEIDENGQYIFKTSQYMFKETYDGKYQYRDIGIAPMIEMDIE